MTSPTPDPTRRPARPSAAVYRRRRLVALLLPLLVVAGVVWGVSTLLGRRDVAAVAPAAAAEAVESPPSASGHVTGCAAEDIAAEVAVEPADTGASIEVSMRNTGEVPCLVGAGPGTLVAEIGSGTDPVWSSAHCAGDATGELLLDTGAATPVPVRWDGHRSAQGCPGDQPQAGPGTYRLAVTLDGRPLGGTEVFTLG